MVLTPNMNLIQPVIGTATGLEWEQATNANSSTVDGHNHSPGSGVPINQNSIALTGDFSFLSFSAIDLLSTRFTPQLSPLAGASDLGCLYVSGVDLWFNDANGNQVQMTSGGSVLATSSGITSGTASASFSAGVLIVNAASNTPANIRGASILLGNNVVNSKYLTLSPPAAMAANYGLVLPPLPGSTLFVTLDSSGNMGTASSIQGTQIATNSLSGLAITDGTITPAKLAALGQQVSSSSAGFTYTFTGSTAFSAVTNLSVTITTSGRPVAVEMIPDGTSSSCVVVLTGGSAGSLRFAKGGVNIGTFALSTSDTPSSGFRTVDVVGAGTYTYSVQVALPTTGSLAVNATKLIAYEM